MPGVVQVRRAAAQHLAKFAAVVEPEFVAREFVAHFHQLTQDGAHVADLSEANNGTPWAIASCLKERMFNF